MLGVRRKYINLQMRSTYSFTLFARVSCIVQCCWILQLRQVQFSSINDVSLGTISSIQFTNRLIGNIGAPIRPLDTDTMDFVLNERVIFSDNPLSAMIPAETIVDHENLLTDLVRVSVSHALMVALRMILIVFSHDPEELVYSNMVVSCTADEVEQRVSLAALQSHYMYH